ncbi:hypothetical protein P3H15_32750 [Rhodococcus sp. T2V]|uniref:hypothetical protein n=1 Tax=Rhodococcus sp. T2V TaxID=3034164 RepID=UPI0023E160BE|nr:hypothetical protein [Rhodococcus sp. T2V]MDF3309790.1 hypothetical protein [Rhodococcus sp. T2V]
MTELKTRRPTGAVPWPLVLVEGGEKAGKSWSIAELSASPRVGRTLWLDLGEGAGDEYGAIPGARYELIEHDGTWSSIMGQVSAARDEAQRALDAGEKPVVLAIDSMTAEWGLLKDWVDAKARRRDVNRKALAQDPDVEVEITNDLWNLATARHKDLMRILMRFPGIVIMAARGADQVAMENGQPTKIRTWKVEGQKALAFDATAWVRMSRTEHPRIIGARSVHAGIVPGEDKPRVIPDLKLDALIFDILKCDPAKAHVRDLVSTPDLAAVLALLAEVNDRDSYTVVWELARDADLLDSPVDDATLRDAMYVQRDKVLAAEAKATESVTA